MAINVQHSASPALLGTAANLIGQEDRRRREEEMAIQQQRLAMAEQDQQFRQQMALAELNQGRYQFDTQMQLRMDEARRNRQFQLASDAMRGNQRLQALNTQGLRRQQQSMMEAQQEAEAMQMEYARQQMIQDAMTQRQQAGYRNKQEEMRAEWEREQQVSDWKRVVSEMKDADPEDQAAILNTFFDHYDGRNLPMPMRYQPPEPEPNPLDPEVIADRIMKNDPTLRPFVLNEDGIPERIRGTGPDDDPVIREYKQKEAAREFRRQMKLEEKKQEAKAAAEFMTARNNYSSAVETARKNALSIFTRPVVKKNSTTGMDETVEMLDEEAYGKFVKQQEIKFRGMYMPPPWNVPVPPDKQAFPWVFDKKEADTLEEGTKVITLINGVWTIIESDGDPEDGKKPKKSKPSPDAEEAVVEEDSNRELWDQAIEDRKQQLSQGGWVSPGRMF